MFLNVKMVSTFLADFTREQQDLRYFATRFNKKKGLYYYATRFNKKRSLLLCNGNVLRCSKYARIFLEMFYTKICSFLKI